MKNFLEQLDWRFATKSFDTEKKVSQENLDKILEAVQKAPSSFGLQTFHVEVILNPELRKKMREVSFDQPQVTDSSHIFVFCGRNDVDERITSMVENMSGGNMEIKKDLEGFENIRRDTMEGKDGKTLMNWASRQAYLALGFGLAACAELEIDACPMEGFDSKALHEVLGLPEHIFPFAYMAVGYRKEDPTHPKFRFPKNDLFTIRD